MKQVAGYHGTSASAAANILQAGFRPSRQPFDWLGDGVYFFQESEPRARVWATQQHADDAAVLEAAISLDGCMDLLDPDWFTLLNESYDAVVAQTRRAGQRLPIQRGGAHGMDRLVINYAVGILERAGSPIRSVRAVFQEGNPAFPGSALQDRSHIQVAVRDQSAITSLRIVEDGEP